MSGLRFNDIAKSSVPVLLPFDAAGYAKALAAPRHARDAAAEQPRTAAADRFMQAGFHASNFFLAGPAGYDAAFSLDADDFPALDISYSKPIYVLFSGLAMVYDLGGPPLPEGEPVKELEARLSRHPPLSARVAISATASTRYGVTYVAAIFCLDRSGRRRFLSCRQADRVAQRFLRALKLAGGAPQPARHSVHAAALDRPQHTAPEFTYYSPGNLIPGTGPNRERRRPRRLHRLCAPALPDQERARLRQFAVLQQLGQLRFHRPHARRHQEGRDLYAAGSTAARSSSTRRRRATTPIRGAIISASTGISMSANARAATAIRARTSAPASASSTIPAPTAACPISTTWWRCMTA